MKVISTMQRKLSSSSLIPAGLVVDGILADVAILTITARALANVANCPLCGGVSSRVHSRYIRHVSDLPCAGRGLGFALLPAASGAVHQVARDGSSPNASKLQCSSPAHAGPQGSTGSFTTSALLLAGVPERASPNGSCCR